MKKSTSQRQDGLPLIGKNPILPIPNATGNPYDNSKASLAKINDENELKGLQVKAELDKLGAPSRSFSEYLALDPSAAPGDDMEDCAALGEPKKMTLNERFAKI